MIVWLLVGGVGLIALVAMSGSDEKPAPVLGPTTTPKPKPAPSTVSKWSCASVGAALPNLVNPKVPGKNAEWLYQKALGTNSKPEAHYLANALEEMGAPETSFAAKCARARANGMPSPTPEISTPSESAPATMDLPNGDIAGASPPGVTWGEVEDQRGRLNLREGAAAVRDWEAYDYPMEVL